MMKKINSSYGTSILLKSGIIKAYKRYLLFEEILLNSRKYSFGNKELKK